MALIDVIILVLVAVIILLSSWYIRRAKKKGVKCIGCPEGIKCSQTCVGCKGCHSHGKAPSCPGQSN